MLINATFYTLKYGLSIVDMDEIKPRPSKNYDRYGTGILINPYTTNNKEEIEKMIYQYPPRIDNLGIYWYVIKYQSDGYHVDGQKYNIDGDTIKFYDNSTLIYNETIYFNNYFNLTNNDNIYKFNDELNGKYFYKWDSENNTTPDGNGQIIITTNETFKAVWRNEKCECNNRFCAILAYYLDICEDIKYCSDICDSAECCRDCITEITPQETLQETLQETPQETPQETLQETHNGNELKDETKNKNNYTFPIVGAVFGLICIIGGLVFVIKMCKKKEHINRRPSTDINTFLAYMGN